MSEKSQKIGECAECDGSLKEHYVNSIEDRKDEEMGMIQLKCVDCGRMISLDSFYDYQENKEE